MSKDITSHLANIIKRAIISQIGSTEKSSTYLPPPPSLQLHSSVSQPPLSSSSVQQSRPQQQINRVFFWLPDDENGYLSNWFRPANFVDPKSKLKFTSSEQYYMAAKAAIAGDKKRFMEIMRINEPEPIKKLGRAVNPKTMVTSEFIKLWEKNRVSIMKVACYLKFSQNHNLKTALLSTGDAELAEASPFDTVWGIGMRKEQAELIDKFDKLPGKNYLGKVLMDLRKQLSEGRMDHSPEEEDIISDFLKTLTQKEIESLPIIRECPPPNKNPPPVKVDKNKRATVDDFINAQDTLMKGAGGLTQYEKALTEIKNGLKETCWIWFVLPSDLPGSSSSDNSKFYCIGPLAEFTAKQNGITEPVTVREYLDNPTLCCRYVEMLNEIGIKLSNFMRQKNVSNRDLSTKKFLIELMGGNLKYTVDFDKLTSSLLLFYDVLVEKKLEEDWAALSSGEDRTNAREIILSEEIVLLYQTLKYFYTNPS